MRERLRNALIMLRSQLWVVPIGMSCVAIVLAFALLGWKGSWLFNGDAETARNLLSALLSGLLTMTSLVVSITFVILTLASNQLGPRLVINFISDRQIQVVIGLFLGTSLYILVVLRSLDGTLGPEQLPHVAVTASTVLTTICLFALLFYVHKVARSTVADTVAEQVYGRLLEAIDSLPDQEEVEGRDTSSPPAGFDAPRLTHVGLGRTGYIQTIDYDGLVVLADKHDVQFLVTVRAGHFVLKSGEHVVVHGTLRHADDELEDAVRGAFVLGAERSPAQDLEYSIRQLVEIGLRALSPGINDPFTAIAVIDRLGAGLEEIMSKTLHPSFYRDDGGTVRVIADHSHVEGIIDACFTQLRQAGSEHPSVLIHLADTFARLSGSAAGERAHAGMLAHLRAIEEAARSGRLIATDQAAVLVRAAAAIQAVEGLAVATGKNC